MTKLEFQKIANSMLEYRVENHQNHIQLTMEGEVDLLCEPLLHHIVTTIPHHKHITVDLRGIAFFLPSIGYRFLVRLAKKAGKNNKELRVVVHEGSTIEKIFNILDHSSSLFDVHYEPSKN